MCKLIAIEKNGVYQFTLTGYVTGPSEVHLLINGKRLKESEYRIQGKFNYTVVCSCYENEVIEYKLAGGKIYTRWFYRPKFTYKYITKFVCREKFTCIADTKKEINQFRSELSSYGNMRERLLNEILNKFNTVDDRLKDEVRCRLKDYDMLQTMIKDKHGELKAYLYDRLKEM